MSWNYRVLRRDQHGEISYAIHEVYYDEHGKPHSCTVDEVSPSGESLEELREDMAHYTLALQQPVLDYDNHLCEAQG